MQFLKARFFNFTENDQKGIPVNTFKPCLKKLSGSVLRIN